ncbi:MAG TPA: PilZ domain-containing protein [Syntrophobacteraceae bacterium]|nr:PilZ domain-containing protein [Syntrophobacteraceae bacterium]
MIQRPNKAADYGLSDSVDSRGFLDVRKDQRRYKRLKVQAEVFAAFVIPGQPIIVGKILDVSSGGIGVQYLGTRRLEKGPTRIKIFRLNSSHMQRAQSTVVYDLEMSGEPGTLPKVHRCGVKFEANGPDVFAGLKVLCKIHQQYSNSEQNLETLGFPHNSSSRIYRNRT